MRHSFVNIQTLLLWFFNTAALDIHNAQQDMLARKAEADDLLADLRSLAGLPSVGVARYDPRETEGSASAADDRMLQLLRQEAYELGQLRRELRKAQATYQAVRAEYREYCTVQRQIGALLTMQEAEMREALTRLYTTRDDAYTIVTVADWLSVDESTLRARLDVAFAAMQLRSSTWLTEARLPFFFQRYPECFDREERVRVRRRSYRGMPRSVRTEESARFSFA